MDFLIVYIDMLMRELYIIAQDITARILYRKVKFIYFNESYGDGANNFNLNHEYSLIFNFSSHHQNL